VSAWLGGMSNATYRDHVDVEQIRGGEDIEALGQGLGRSLEDERPSFLGDSAQQQRNCRACADAHVRWCWLFHLLGVRQRA
jgi:hypothetical protein